jgi:hypothetical protein
VAKAVLLGTISLLVLSTSFSCARAEDVEGNAPAPRDSIGASPVAQAASARPASVAKAVSIPARRRDGLEALNPELADHPYALASGPREYRHRLSFSPGYGQLGSDRLFTARIAYNPSPWLGYEAAIGHNPGQSTHAVLHTISAIGRYPLPGRFQPYLSAGYGMVMVFPGRSINAAPVTKNTLAMGGGLEFYIRNDLALRAEMRHATVFGRERDREGVVAYDYLQETIGLAFYRSIKP